MSKECYSKLRDNSATFRCLWAHAVALTETIVIEMSVEHKRVLITEKGGGGSRDSLT